MADGVCVCVCVCVVSGYGNGNLVFIWKYEKLGVGSL